MKIKSLLLTGMAALAMFSCSNENDPAVAGNEVTKDAAFTFSFTMPNVATRAETDPAGTAQEQKVNDITLELTYPNSTIPPFIETYQAAEFTKANNLYTLSTAALVSPGTAKIALYVNTNGIPANQIVESIGAFDLGMNASTEGNGNFTMSGESSATFDIAQSETNTAPTVDVSRIAAKLVEVSDADAEAEGLQHKYKATASGFGSEINLYLELVEYSFSNLNKKSNVLAGEKYYNVADLWNAFTPANTEALWTDIFGSNTKEMANNLTYAFENGAETPTTIWYKAKVSFENYTEGDNFYVLDEVLYENYAELNKKFNDGLEASFGLTDESSNAEFMTEVGAMKYTTGLCYFSTPIKTGNNISIERNNWYNLKVTGIKDLGMPEPGTPPIGAPTLLIFSAEVQPWTVIDFDYEL